MRNLKPLPLCCTDDASGEDSDDDGDDDDDGGKQQILIIVLPALPGLLFHLYVTNPTRTSREIAAYPAG